MRCWSTARRRPVFHPFSDMNLSGHHSDHLTDVLSYSLPELMGEKLRALAERCRATGSLRRDPHAPTSRSHRTGTRRPRRPRPEVCPRRHRHPHARVDSGDRLPIRDRDRVAEHARPPAALTYRHSRPSGPNSTTSSPGSKGGVAVPILEPIPVGDDVTPWRPARYMTTWRTGAPLELIRFAGANRLKVVLDYRPQRGGSARGSSSPTRCVDPVRATSSCSSGTTVDSSGATGSTAFAAPASSQRPSRPGIASNSDERINP